MLLSLAIFFAVASVAAAIGKFVLHLDSKPSADLLGYDHTGCYENWAAHRACPQGLPVEQGR